MRARLRRIHDAIQPLYIYTHIRLYHHCYDFIIYRFIICIFDAEQTLHRRIDEASSLVVFALCSSFIQQQRKTKHLFFYVCCVYNHICPYRDEYATIMVIFNIWARMKSKICRINTLCKNRFSGSQPVCR